MKTSQVIAECRGTAKKVGLTFKRSNMSINGSPAYHFTDRKTGTVVLENCTLGSAYEKCCSGFIDNYDSDNGIFTQH